MARQGKARRGAAGQGVVGHCLAWPGWVRLCMARLEIYFNWERCFHPEEGIATCRFTGWSIPFLEGLYQATV